MCFGGGGSAATITMPDTGAYDRMARRQMMAMEATMNNPGMAADQSRLEAAQAAQQQQATQLRDITIQQANDTAAQAARLSQLMGTPPPEEPAGPPVVGTTRRGLTTTRGKSALRIEQTTASQTAAGAGLNIT